MIEARQLFAWYDVFNDEITRDPMQALRAMDGGNVVIPLWALGEGARHLAMETPAERSPLQPLAAHVMTEAESRIADLHLTLGAPDIAQHLRNGALGVIVIDSPGFGTASLGRTVTPKEQPR